MKQFAAILSVVLLVWAQFAPASAATTACGKPVASQCGAACGGHMACCAAKPDNSQPAATIPATASAQNEISLIAPAMVAWLLPNQPRSLFSSAVISPLVATGTPLYARHCSRLI